MVIDAPGSGRQRADGWFSWLSEHVGMKLQLWVLDQREPVCAGTVRGDYPVPFGVVIAPN